MSQEQTLAVKLTADIERFQRNLNYAKRSLSEYSDSVDKGQKSNVGFNYSLENVVRSASTLKTEFFSMTAGMVVGLTGLATATVLTIDKFSDQGKELEKQATMADISIERIQSLAYASEQYGISGDKMADILKDVNDKFGDFAQTGGGEFSDFFEQILPKVNLTIDELQSMAGPEALVAVKSAMDAANIPMKDQIFYLEGLANDASALLPLLDSQGKKLYELTERYEGLNVAMSEMDIKNFKEMDQNLSDVGLKMNRAWANAVLGSKEQIDWFSDVLVDTLNWWGALWDNWDNDPTTTNGIQSRINSLEKDLLIINKQLAFAETQKQSFKDQHLDLDWRNWDRGKQIDKTVDELKAKRVKLQSEIDQLKKSFGDDGNSRDFPEKPSVRAQPDVKLTPKEQAELERQQKSSAAKLSSLDVQYAGELEKLRLSHAERLQEIENLQLSEAEVHRRGYDSLSALQQDYAAQENAFYTAQLNERQVKRENELNKKLESFQTEVEAMQVQAAQQMAITAAGDDAQAAQEDAAYQNRLIKLRDHFNDAYIAAGENDAAKLELNKQYLDAEEALFNEHQSNLTQIAKTAAEKRAQDEEKTRSMQFSGVSSFFGQMAQLQTSENKKAASAGKAFARANILMNTYEMATKAYNSMVGIPYVGPVLATAAAGAAVGFGMAQYNAVGMAHDGIDTVPQEGTWLLNTGERVYTNESVAKLDQMYSAIMSLYSAISSVKVANDSTYNVKGGNAQGAIVNIYQAPEGTYAKQSINEDGRQQIDVFCQDMNEGGEMAQAISTRFDLPIKGSL